MCFAHKFCWYSYEKYAKAHTPVCFDFSRLLFGGDNNQSIKQINKTPTLASTSKAPLLSTWEINFIMISAISLPSTPKCMTEIFKIHIHIRIPCWCQCNWKMLVQKVQGWKQPNHREDPKLAQSVKTSLDTVVSLAVLVWLFLLI